MAAVVRINKRMYRWAQLNTHYESYNSVLPNTETQFVPGEGDILSPVVIIGEAPGEEEERLGRPFVGKSGNMLGKWLKSVGLSRGEVFITNLVKHRPPGNANPTHTQAAAARQLMLWELAILKPRVVVTLGKFATEVFYPTPHMNTLSGTCRVKFIDPDRKVEAWIVPMFHPAYVLRGTSNLRHKAEEHFQVIRPLLE